MTKRLWKKGVLVLLAILLVAVFGVLGHGPHADAANPGTISFQGKVVNANGTNVTDGTYSFVFKLYTVSSGGAAVWTETDSLSVNAGVFQVNLGAVSSLSGIDFNANPNLYLGITFNSDPAGEMSPRVQLQSVPYAFNSDKVGGLTAGQLVQLSPGSGQTGFISVSGGNTTINSSGSGTTTIGGSSGALTIGGASAGTIGLQTGGSNAITLQSANALNFTAGAASTWNLGTNTLAITSSKFTVDASGNTTLGGTVAVQGTGNSTISGTLTFNGTGGALSDLVDLGANIPANGQNLLVYHSANFRTGLGIQSNVFRLFTSTGAIFSFGHVSTADGSTYTENARIDASGNLEVGTTGAASARVVITGPDATSSNNALNVTNSTPASLLTVRDDGQITIGTFTSAGIVHSSAAGVLSDSAVVLGTDTSGSYVATLSNGTGTTVTGGTGAGSNPSVNVTYGSSANMAVQGNTSFTCTNISGSNLSFSGSTSITEGAGGTCGSISLSNSPSFSGSVTAGTGLIATTGGLTVSAGGASITGDITGSGRVNLSHTTGTSGQGYFIRNGSSTPITSFQGLDTGSSSFGFFGVNKYYNGSAWVDDGQSRVGSSFQLQDNTFNFYQFDTAANFHSRLVLAANGNLGVGQDVTPAYLLDVEGGDINTSANLRTGGTIRLSNTGALSNITTLTASGLLTGVGLNAGAGLIQGTAGLTITGGVVSLNAGSNFAVNIATGTSTGAVSIGGGSNTFALNSTALDISTAGAITGATSITASGTITGATINATTNFQANGTPGVDFTCGNNQYANQLAVNNGIVTGHSACSGVGLSDVRLKTNITSLPTSTLGQLAGVNPVTFNFDCNNPYFADSDTYCQTAQQTGVIAQQLMQIFPQLVSTDDYGYYHVDYQGLSVETLAGVVELAHHLDANGNADLATATATSVITPSLTSNGALSIDSGSTGNVSIDTGSPADVNIGTGLSTAVNLSRVGQTTTVNGGLVVNQAGDFSGNVHVGGNLSLNGSFALVGAGGQTVISFDNSGNANFNGNLNLASASLSGGLTVGGDINVAGLSTFQKMATFLAKTVFRQDVEFDGHITVASDTAGYASLRSGESIVHVTFAKPYDNPPVVTANIVNGQFGLSSVNNVTDQGFDLSLSAAATADTTFSWTAIGVNNPQTAVNTPPSN